MGGRWWRLLRGDDPPEPPTVHRSLGHAHVLPPDLRNDSDVRTVLAALIHKAAARLRAEGHWAGANTFRVDFIGRTAWQERRQLSLCKDTLTMLRAFRAAWSHKPAGVPLKVGVVLDELVSDRNASHSLFHEDRRLLRPSQALDELNGMFGQHAVHFAGMEGGQNHTPMRIAFTRVPDA